MRTLKALPFTFLVWPICTLAHEVAEGGARTEGSEVALLSILFSVGIWYAIGAVRVLRFSANSRHALLFRIGLFSGAWLALALTLLTPLHELGSRSFTAHMIEHELLMLVAAPLLAFSQPLAMFVWALPKSVRLACGKLGHNAVFSRVWQGLSGLLSTTIIQALVLWGWHVPALFDLALRSEAWHIAQHLSFVLSAVLFWWSIHRVARVQKNAGAAAAFLFFTSLHSSLLGAFMAFAASPWYAQYVALSLSGAASLTPLEDQQLAGLIMWIPGGAVHAIAALIYFRRSLTTGQVSDRQWQSAN